MPLGVSFHFAQLRARPRRLGLWNRLFDAGDPLHPLFVVAVDSGDPHVGRVDLYVEAVAALLFALFPFQRDRAGAHVHAGHLCAHVPVGPARDPHGVPLHHAHGPDAVFCAQFLGQGAAHLPALRGLVGLLQVAHARRPHVIPPSRPGSPPWATFPMPRPPRAPLCRCPLPRLPASSGPRRCPRTRGARR